MTIEDRLRATTEAVTEAMRPVRPLDLRPDAIGAQLPARPRPPRRPRRWPGWLAPVAAAAAVIVVAATLVSVRALSGPAPHGAGPSGAATSGAAANADQAPAYYVALTDIGTSRGGTMVRNAFLADARTGKQLATFKPPSDAIFEDTAASSDDKTFVLDAVAGRAEGPSGSQRLANSASTSHLWYLVRLTPGAAQQARLTRIPIASSFTDVVIEGLAVSPDGRTLAVLSQAIADVAGTVKPSGATTLRTYSLATGQVMRSWTAPSASSSIGAFGDLSWLDDGHTVAFVYPNRTTQRYVRTLNTTSPGTSLMADSRAVFSVPTGHTCDDSLLMTADGKAVICGVLAPNDGWCTSGQLALNAYSVATGKLENVLYRYQGGCHFGIVQVVWAKSATLAIGLITISRLVNPSPPVTNTVGVATPGKFTALPVALAGGTYDAPGTVAF